MPGSSRRHSTTPEYTCRDSSSSTSDRRHSTSSDTSLPDSSHFRQLSQENLEYIPTRMKQVTASKPAANPLQFVKVGPCGLYRSAQEQLKKVEEVKKMKQQVKEEAEDWQSNLDNWKSSRRKRQEHIIERVVEVKKLELEEFDRNRRRSKTFNEMMEERNSRGRKVSLVMYKEEDANDLSDLGIGTSSGKSSVCGDYGNDDTQSTSDREETEKHQYEHHNGSQGKNGVNGHREDRSDSVTTSSPEPEEYTYERAIQSYVDFTATRVKSKAADRKSLSSSREELDEVSKLSNGHSAKSPPPPPVKPRRESNPKIEGRLTGLDQRRRSSADLNSIPDSSRLFPLPKVDVLKRRELFEKASESNEVTPKISTRKSGLSTTQTIKERLSNLEKQTETSSNLPKSNNRISATEISSSLKERLSSLQKQKSNDNLLEKDTVKDNHRLSCSDISTSQSIRTRLSQLEKQKSSEDENEPVSPNRQSGDFSHSIKERLSNLDAACHKENAKRVTPDRDPSFSNKLANFQNTESLPQGDEHTDKNEKTITAESERSVSPDDVEIYPSKRQQFHRSLDSLDVESSNDVVNEAFERVQSLEDLDCCNRARNYPASASSTEMLAFSSQSGDTDREDSGIHTADVSCSVSQADEPVEDGEIITAITSVVPHFELDKNGRDSYHLEVEIVSHKAQGSGISEQLSPIPQEDSSETCTMAFCHIENNVNSSSSVPEDKNVQHSMDSNDTSTQADSSCDVVDSLTVGGDAEKPASSLEEGVFAANICPTSDEEQLGEEVVEVCLRVKIPDVALAEKRKTVVEVCEKVDITQIPGGLKSPPPTPFILVPSCVQAPASMPLEEEEVTKSSVIEDTKDSPEREIFYSAFEVLDDKMKEPESLVQDGGAPVEETPIQKETIQPVLQEKPIAPPRITQKSDESEVFLPVSSQIPPLSLSGDIEIVSGLSFPLGPPTSAEPPKEKPPPPPTEASDEEAPLPESPLRRLDSTKRIKKEIRRKRSDFLGIEGKTDDDSYLEPELQVSRPPDINSFLVEERRLEQQLYRQSICSESDSNLGETTESRDSGVELERGHSDDNWSTKQPLTPDVLSAEHSRQNSELYGNASITSEEDEITKKEREIIEILEKEEQWRYGNNKLNQQDSIGEKLAEKLRQLEQEKMRLEWERTEEANRRQAEANARREEELRLRAKEEELRQQERVSPKKQSAEDEKEEVKASGENLRSERERLQQEQEALLRQKESLQAQVLHQHQRWSSQSALPSQQWDAAPLPTHLSLQDVSNVAGYPSADTPPPARPPEPLNYRLSLPDLQQDPQSGIVVASAGQNLRPSPARRAPPPIPPSKPLRVVSQEQIERDNSIRSSRMPSADSLPHQVEPAHAHHNSVPTQVSSSQQMTRQTLQALSAVPRSRLINNDTWIQAKKKPESQRNTLNNQHWLIQEAEHRRITEQHQRNSTSPRKTLPPQYWTQQQKQPQQPQQVPQRQDKPLPDSIIQTLTQRVQNRATLGDNKKVSNRIRPEDNPSRDNPATGHYNAGANNPPLGSGDSQEKMLSVSGKKKCSHCGDELGRGAAMIIESLRLFYHIDCFKCCVCHVQLGDGLMGTDVRVRNNKLHCHNCYSSDDGVKFSCV
ncbi:calponin homology domain-containing protein DDB_G0272472 isoform X2 [Anabrus simplex]|uniref:calponin homology domain-containing protein DDB_G0272472 isoform X2 n=1 Tax=Anabrus simplex TaxID=316456 RepID=UPI0035A3811D